MKDDPGGWKKLNKMEDALGRVKPSKECKDCDKLREENEIRLNEIRGQLKAIETRFALVDASFNSLRSKLVDLAMRLPEEDDGR